MMKALTALEVKALAAPGAHRVDDGLYLQIKGGGKSWLHRYKRNGKQRWAGLGSYPEVSLAEARAARDDQRAMLRKDLDPVASRQAEKAASALAAAKAITFKECAEAYVRAHQAAWRSSVHAKQWAVTLESYVYPAIGALQVASIDTALAMRVLEPIWPRIPETASRVRGRCEVILDWAKARGYRDGENPFRWRGHLAMLLPAKTKIRAVQHHAAMPFSEVPMFMASLRSREGFTPRALELLILTCLRTNEVLGARWDEFDMASKVWTVPASRMKAGKMHRVPLSTPALYVVEQMAAIRQCEFVFPGARGKLNKVALDNVLSRMGETITVHGFRSSFRDWAGKQTNFPREWTEMVLAHAVGNAVERAYWRDDLLEERRRIMDAWANYCARPAISGENIVSLRASA